MKQILLSVALCCSFLTAKSQCTPQAEIDENFSSFTEDELPQNCWSKLTTGPLVYIDGTDDRIATLYSLFSPNVPAFLISPELSTVDGNHVLSFDAIKAGAASVTIQPGLMSNPADETTFQAVGNVIELTDIETPYLNVAFPASTTHKYVALKFVAGSVHHAALIDNFKWQPVPCPDLAIIDEDFSSFTEDELPQNCWSKLTAGPMVYIDGTDNRVATLYSFFSPNTPAYLITPGLSTVDGAHSLSFDAIKAGAASVTIQPGLMSNPADETTFQAVGNIIELTDTETPYLNIAFPASTTHKYVALKFVAGGLHHAALIDNFKWQSTAGVKEVNLNNLSIYPNPTVNKNVSVSFNQVTADTSHIAVYTITGAKVHEAEIKSTAGLNTINLNLSGLTSGMYIIQIQSGNASLSKKLIVQ